MQIRKNISKILFLSIFASSMVFTPSSVKADSDYAPGSLLKIKGVKGAAVYQIGNDGKKYVYPDQRTFNTWHDDFSGVVEVALEELDNISDGGTVTFQPGTRLITHPNTAKVYAVGEDGELIYIPNEETARNFYGNTWYQLVLDIDPGLFAVSYKIRKGTLSDNNLPEGSLVEEEDSGDLFVIEAGQRRLVKKELLRQLNLHRKYIIKLKRLLDIYDDGDDINDDDDDDVGEFRPDKIILCHKPDVANTTIRVSERSLKAHLAHGDTRGACEGSNNDDEDDDEDDDNDNTLVTDIKLSDIMLSPSSPTVNATTTITAYIKNNGNTSITNADIVFDTAESFSDFTIESTATSTVSATDPLVSGETVTVVWTGYFTTTSTKSLSVSTDSSDILDESDETNNTRTESVTVLDEEIVLPDITVSDISLDPSSPTVNATTTITAYIKNSGTVSLTDTTGILNWLVSFEDWQNTASSTVPVVSLAEPFNPEETLSIVWTGYFTSTSTKALSMTADESNELAEGNETNNTRSEDVSVLAEVI